MSLFLHNVCFVCVSLASVSVLSVSHTQMQCVCVCVCVCEHNAVIPFALKCHAFGETIQLLPHLIKERKKEEGESAKEGWNTPSLINRLCLLSCFIYVHACDTPLQLLA